MLLLILAPLAIGTYDVSSYLIVHGVRQRVDALAGEARLQDWAVEVLSQHKGMGNSADHDAVYALKDSELPDFVRRVCQSSGYGDAVRIVRDDSGGEYMDITISQERTRRWGVRVGGRSFRPKSDGSDWKHKWRDGMYGYYETFSGGG